MLVVISCLIPLQSIAAIEYCDNVKLETVVVEGPRDDNFYFQNKLLLKLDQECFGMDYVYAGLKHPALNGFIAIALAAKAADKPVRIAINTNTTTALSHQIAFIELQ
ncbi:MAG: hypothetical protein ACI88A_004896 [Paraglaciecola sp.]